MHNIELIAAGVVAGLGAIVRAIVRAIEHCFAKAHELDKLGKKIGAIQHLPHNPKETTAGRKCESCGASAIEHKACNYCGSYAPRTSKKVNDTPPVIPQQSTR